MENKIQKLTDYFRDYVTPHKQQLYEEMLNHRTRYLTIILENIFQPQNASAVIRTAECYGIQDIHIIENEYEYKLNKNVVMGATKWLDMFRYSEEIDNTADALRRIKQKGYKIYGAHPNPDALSINDIDISQPFALLFGTEKTGLSDTAIANVDEQFFIPMYGFTESYNISVSAAIALTILKQRLINENINYLLTDEEKDRVRLDWYKKNVRRADLLEKNFLKNNSDIER